MEGVLSVGLVVNSFSALSGSLATGSFSEIVTLEASICPFCLQHGPFSIRYEGPKGQRVMPNKKGISPSHLPMLRLTGVPA